MDQLIQDMTEERDSQNRAMKGRIMWTGGEEGILRLLQATVTSCKVLKNAVIPSLFTVASYRELS